MKKIQFYLLIVLVTFVVTGCNNVDNQDKKSKNVIQEASWQESAKEECVLNAMNDLRAFSTNYNNLFSNWLNELKKCDNNSFAQKIIEESSKIGYDEWNQYEKDILDTYLLKMLSVTDFQVNTNDINNSIIVNAYWTDTFTYHYNFYAKENEGTTKLLYITYDVGNQFNENENNNGAIDESYAYRFQSYHVLGNPLNETIFDSLNKGNTSFYFYEKGNGNWDIYTDKHEDTTYFSFVKLNVNEINNKITSSKNLLEFIKEYRNQVYKPLRDEQMKKEREEWRSKNQKSEPSIGDSESIVKSSTWGIPDKINKDVYANGTFEQWVYKNKGYIYLINGKVHSISYR